MLGAVESHVLQEVGQTKLILVLERGTHLLRDVEVGTLLRLLVVQEVVRQAVVQLAVSYFRIQRNRRILSVSHDTGHSQHGQTRNLSDHIYIVIGVF